MFQLHRQLEVDTMPLGRFDFCRLLLMSDSNYPWFILVPERENIRELYELSATDRHQLADESTQLSRALAAVFQPDKLNIAALGNHVPQLHVHHIVRYKSDAAWPDPVWGKVPPRPYYSAEIVKLKRAVCPHLGDNFKPA
ncbi:MAG: HIT domain-containing protein [Gammaproteobacteria bacterium]